LSGNGPSYVAFGSKSEMEELGELWSDYGKVYVRKIANNPAEDVVVPEVIFEI